MKIDYIIMAHHSRSAYLKDLLWQLPQDKTTASIDQGTLGVWENAKRSWSKVDPKSDYGIVIQDDAILCDGFTKKAEQFLTEHDGQIISFYYGNETKWVKPNYFDAPLFHAVALAIPTKLIPEMIAYCDTRHEVFGDDMKIKRWLISKNLTCRYSNPSLVQHRDIPSIIDPQKPIRQSNIFQQ